MRDSTRMCQDGWIKEIDMEAPQWMDGARRDGVQDIGQERQNGIVPSGDDVCFNCASIQLALVCMGNQIRAKDDFKSEESR